MKQIEVLKSDDYDPPSGSGKAGWVPPCLLFIAISPALWFASGFNKNKAINSYQKSAHEFSCPYGRDGSCSETFRNDGLKALICKCHETRKEVRS